jgi:hypothetical protein
MVEIDLDKNLIAFERKYDTQNTEKYSFDFSEQCYILESESESLIFLKEILAEVQSCKSQEGRKVSVLGLIEQHPHNKVSYAHNWIQF